MLQNAVHIQTLEEEEKEIYQFRIYLSQPGTFIQDTTYDGGKHVDIVQILCGQLELLVDITAIDDQESFIFLHLIHEVHNVLGLVCRELQVLENHKLRGICQHFLC